MTADEQARERRAEIDRKADELIRSWINGNRSDVLDELAEIPRGVHGHAWALGLTARVIKCVLVLFELDREAERQEKAQRALVAAAAEAVEVFGDDALEAAASAIQRAKEAKS